MQFEVGDRVKIVRSYRPDRVGRIGTVYLPSRRPDLLYIRLDNGVTMSTSPHLVRLVTDLEEIADAAQKEE